MRGDLKYMAKGWTKILVVYGLCVVLAPLIKLYSKVVGGGDVQ